MVDKTKSKVTTGAKKKVSRSKTTKKTSSKKTTSRSSSSGAAKDVSTKSALGNEDLSETPKDLTSTALDSDRMTLENGQEDSPPLEERFFNKYSDPSQSQDEHSSQQVGDGSHSSQGKGKQNAQPGFVINLSQSLARKIKQQAAEEGISVNDFISELLSEGVVLRAWEIVERKNQMRGHGNSGNQSSQGGRSGNHGSRGHNRHNKGSRGGMSHGRYQSIMDDKATFLEYVRNQERSRR